jgi:predicted AlkP superfamily phosphohydrolase/phosphomutase
LFLIVAAALVLTAPLPVRAAARGAVGYIGPGAGFAMAGSFFAVLVAFCSALLLFLTWPARIVWRALFGRRPLAQSQFKRVVILGLDGLDHALTERMLAEGKLPNLAALRDRGCFKPLGSTLPPISPVAWSTFQTGVNPGKHNIFDFLVPDPKTYQPKLSSVEIRPSRHVLHLGKYRLPLRKADVRLLRKSKPFWHLLGERGIPSCILRVPITFPPEKLRGVLLSAMCAPDLRGTQGMFSFYTTRPPGGTGRTGGEVQLVTRKGNHVEGELIGPPNPFRADGASAKVPFVVKVLEPGRALLRIVGTDHELRQDQYTPWIRVPFRVAPGISIYGQCKFLLRSTVPEFELYAMPVNLDPESPAMPISSPAIYSVYLSKRQGPFATLGLAEDTWAVNEHVLHDEHFLQQCLDIDGEREVMFFDALDKMPRGLCVVVFDGTDRMQHMFWRDIDPTHPARSEHPVPEGRNLIEDLYQRMDSLVGRTMARCSRGDNLLMVLSDHGFNAFRRGVDLNRWLEENGYLKFHEGRRQEDFLAGVDWSQTRAFALGLSGIFINLKGKYSQGTVNPRVAGQLCEEIARRLTGIIDPQTGVGAIKEVYITSQVYSGPYKDHAPELIPGYQRGYRVAWETAIGRTTEAVFHDNKKAWSGDHCIDPSYIPGVLFCSNPVQAEYPRLMDIGPTVLRLFGVPIPAYIDGVALTVGDAAPTPQKRNASTQVA